MVSRRLAFLLFSIISAGLLLIICFSFLNNPLVFDDEPFFRPGGPEVLLSTGFSLSPRSWVYACMAASFSYLSDKIIWLRVENLVFHGCTALALFGFVRQLLNSLDRRSSFILGTDTTAFIVAFLFAIHPLTIQTQGYLIQRTIVFATLFGLLGLWTFWLGLAGKRWALWTSCMCMLLSLYAKEHAVMLPALCFLLWILHRRSQLPVYFAVGEIFAVLVVQAIIAVSVVFWSKGVIGVPYEVMTEEVLSDEAFKPHGSLYVLSVLNQMGLFFKYLSILALPQGRTLGLDLRVPFPLGYNVWWAWAGMVAFTSYGVASLMLLLRGGSRGLLGFSLLFPWVLFATELVSVRLQEPFVLYRSYLWIPGFFIALALGLRRLKRFYLATLTPVFSIYLLGLSYDRLVTLSAPVLVWHEAVQYYEEQGDVPGLLGGYRIYYNLGVTYLDAGFVDLASENIEKAVVLKPKYEYAHYQRGRIFLLRGKAAEAKLEFERAISLRSDYTTPYLGMADALKSLGQPDEAQRYLELGCDKGSQLACDRAHPKAPLILLPKT